MAVLGWTSAIGVLVGWGCYAPELRDCAVTCETIAECAPDQVCGRDGMCAAPERAGRCIGASGTIDAGIDAAPDARSPIDAALDGPSAQLLIRIEVADRGGVTIAGVGTCHYLSHPSHKCTFAVPAGMTATLTAEPDPAYRFEKWEMGPCIGQGITCVFLPALPQTDIKVKFREDDDD